MSDRTKAKAVKGNSTPVRSGQVSQRIESRDYGEVLIKTPRRGIQIEQLMPEKKTGKRSK
jgi:hypothetical protein